MFFGIINNSDPKRAEDSNKYLDGFEKTPLVEKALNLLQSALYDTHEDRFISSKEGKDEYKRILRGEGEETFIKADGTPFIVCKSN